MKDDPKATENGHKAIHTSTDLRGRDFATLTELELNRSGEAAPDAHWLTLAAHRPPS